MSKRYSLAFKKKMVEQLTGKDPPTQSEVAAKYGVAQYTLSRWLLEARSLPLMPPRPPKPRTWPIDQKIRVLAEASKLNGAELAAYLERERVTLGELEQWRLALEEEGRASKATMFRIRKLERELARKEKALAELAALLVLKKKVDQLQEDEDDDTDEGTEP
jgi:transposase-like protein